MLLSFCQEETGFSIAFQEQAGKPISDRGRCRENYDSATPCPLGKQTQPDVAVSWIPDMNRRVTLKLRFSTGKPALYFSAQVKVARRKVAIFWYEGGDLIGFASAVGKQRRSSLTEPECVGTATAVVLRLAKAALA